MAYLPVSYAQFNGGHINISLARQLRGATSDAHADAERAGIMRNFLAGRIARRSYCALIRNLHPIYLALERALEGNAAHPFIAPIYFPELRRSQALEADLDTLHGTQWEDELVVEAASTQYLARLAELDRYHPELLVAHAYIRYLGDLNGGQILCRLVEKALGLNSAMGTAFYRFEGTENPAELAQRFRAGLDSSHMPEGTRAEIVAEANLSFRLHILLFQELAARFPADH